MHVSKTTEQESNLSDQDRERIRLHLRKLLESRAFAHSHRSQAFLRYIVEEALAGRAAQIKERNVGVDVFGRNENFDPQEESIVRVGAWEVRKRLLHAYQADFGDGVRIEIPVGSYCPTFRLESSAAPVPRRIPAPAAWHFVIPGISAKIRDHQWLCLAASIFGVGTVLFFLLGVLRPRTPLDLLWQSFAMHKQPVLLALPEPRVWNMKYPELLFSNHAKEIPIDAVSPVDSYTGAGAGWGAARFAEQLASRHQQFIIRFGKDVSFPDLAQSPTIIFGGQSSPLSVQMTSNLRYRLISESDKAVIADTRIKGAQWSNSGNKPLSGMHEGYALITILHSTDTGLPLMIVAGLGPADTRAGAEFLTNNSYLQELTKAAPKNWLKKNCQVVLQDVAYGDSPGRPNVVAWYVW